MPETYRADHVGSLLRPPEVKEAKSAFREGRLELSEVTTCVDAGHRPVGGAVTLPAHADGLLRVLDEE